MTQPLFNEIALSMLFLCIETLLLSTHHEFSSVALQKKDCSFHFCSGQRSRWLSSWFIVGVLAGYSGEQSRYRWTMQKQGVARRCRRRRWCASGGIERLKQGRRSKGTREEANGGRRLMVDRNLTCCHARSLTYIAYRWTYRVPRAVTPAGPDRTVY